MSLIAAVPSDPPDPRPERIHLATPTPVPTPIAPPASVAARPVATIRPIPVPAIDAHEVALINLDTGRLDGVFLASGNDAAETLATAATSRSAFIARMNAKATGLGLRTTHFTNPTGLSEGGLHSSAYDLALAAAYLESHYPGLGGIAAISAVTIPATATHKAFTLVKVA